MIRLLQAGIPRRQRNCFGCQKAFAEKQEYHSILGDEEKGIFIRHDYCSECFNNAVAKEKPHVAWKGIVAGSLLKKGDSADRTTHLLDYLKDSLTKPAEASNAFFIALYLARKRVIIYRHEFLNHEGRTLWIYEVAATEEMLTVEKVPLTKLRNPQIQTAVLDLLKKS
jgi:hypothetical protein